MPAEGNPTISPRNAGQQLLAHPERIADQRGRPELAGAPGLAVECSSMRTRFRLRTRI
jgi:hypothetical protein